jgi:hypothetical protein
MNAKTSAQLTTDSIARQVDPNTVFSDFDTLKIYVNSVITKACSNGKYSVEVDLRWDNRTLVGNLAENLKSNGYRVRVPLTFPSDPIVKISWAHHK